MDSERTLGVSGIYLMEGREGLLGPRPRPSGVSVAYATLLSRPMVTASVRTLDHRIKSPKITTYLIVFYNIISERPLPEMQYRA